MRSTRALMRVVSYGLLFAASSFLGGSLHAGENDPSEAKDGKDGKDVEGGNDGEDGEGGNDARDAEGKRRIEGRRASRLSPNSPSRWSNAGVAAASEAQIPVEISTIPARNTSVVGVETPGQPLRARADVLSVRLSLSAYRLSTNTLDRFYFVRDPVNTALGGIDESRDYDIEFLRGRATMAYERIAGSDFGAHLDLEYRPRISGSRPTDQRINELCVSWGLTNFSSRGDDEPSWGIMLGRVAIREAGFAQADGGAFRWRIMNDPGLNVGVFGGVTGNPYGYNWLLRTSQIFSSNWITGGAFGSVRTPDLIANLAGILTYANLPAEPEAAQEARSGLDRVHLAFDAAYLVLPELNVIATGMLDFVSGGQLIQNAELVVAYSPSSAWDLDLALGRFSTVLYELSAGYSYVVDPATNTAGRLNPDDPNVPIVDPDGNPIVPFDAALLSVAYNQARLRVGYRPVRSLELFANAKLALRDLGATDDALSSVGIDNNVEFAALRFLPGGGVRFRDPDILDAAAEYTYVLDDQSQASAIVSASVGRELFGLYLGADGRFIYGIIDGLDGGVLLSYTFPREWTPGRLTIHGTLRLYRERIRGLERPTEEQEAVQQAGMVMISGEDASLQETLLAFGGIEWRY